MGHRINAAEADETFGRLAEGGVAKRARQRSRREAAPMGHRLHAAGANETFGRLAEGGGHP